MQTLRSNYNQKPFYVTKKYFVRWGKHDPTLNVVFYLILADRMEIQVAKNEVEIIQKIFNNTPSSTPHVLPSLEDLKPSMLRRLNTLGGDQNQFELQFDQLISQRQELGDALMFIQNHKTLNTYQPDSGVILLPGQVTRELGIEPRRNTVYVLQENCNSYYKITHFGSTPHKNLVHFDRFMIKKTQKFKGEILKLSKYLDHRSSFKEQIKEFYKS